MRSQIHNFALSEIGRTPDHETTTVALRDDFHPTLAQIKEVLDKAGSGDSVALPQEWLNEGQNGAIQDYSYPKAAFAADFVAPLLAGTALSSTAHDQEYNDIVKQFVEMLEAVRRDTVLGRRYVAKLLRGIEATPVEGFLVLLKELPGTNDTRFDEIAGVLRDIYADYTQAFGLNWADNSHFSHLSDQQVAAANTSRREAVARMHMSSDYVNERRAGFFNQAAYYLFYWYHKDWSWSSGQARDGFDRFDEGTVSVAADGRTSLKMLGAAFSLLASMGMLATLIYVAVATTAVGTVLALAVPAAFAVTYALFKLVKSVVKIQDKPLRNSLRILFTGLGAWGGVALAGLILGSVLSGVALAAATVFIAFIGAGLGAAVTKVVPRLVARSRYRAVMADSNRDVKHALNGQHTLFRTRDIKTRGANFAVSGDQAQGLLAANLTEQNSIDFGGVGRRRIDAVVLKKAIHILMDERRKLGGVLWHMGAQTTARAALLRQINALKLGTHSGLTREQAIRDFVAEHEGVELADFVQHDQGASARRVSAAPDVVYAAPVPLPGSRRVPEPVAPATQVGGAAANPYAMSPRGPAAASPSPLPSTDSGVQVTQTARLTGRGGPGSGEGGRRGGAPGRGRGRGRSGRGGRSQGQGDQRGSTTSRSRRR